MLGDRNTVPPSHPVAPLPCLPCATLRRYNRRPRPRVHPSDSKTRRVSILRDVAVDFAGGSVGYHRLFTYRSFKTTTPVRAAVAIARSMAGLRRLIPGPPCIARHHQCADHEGGYAFSQSPWRKSPRAHPRVLVLHAPICWRTAPFFALRAVSGVGAPWSGDSHYTGRSHQRQLVGCANGFPVGWAGPHVRCRESIRRSTLYCTASGRGRSMCVTTVETTGSSVWRLRATVASFGLAWYRADVSYWFILLLQRIGLAWDVIVPTREQIAARYSPSATVNGLATECRQRPNRFLLAANKSRIRLGMRKIRAGRANKNARVTP